MAVMASTKSRIISAAASVAALLFAGVLPGFAQTATQVPPQQPPIATSPGIANPYPDFFDLAVPGRFSLTLFGGGFYSDKYGVAQEGFQFEQSVTRYIGVVGRASGVELWNGNGFANPFASSGQTTSQGHAYI